MYANACLCLYVFLKVFIWFSFLLFIYCVLVWNVFLLSNFTYTVIILDACLYPNERERTGIDLGEQRIWEELGDGNHNQNIYYKKF